MTENYRVPVPGDTIIAVMGVTGAGKSSFIRNVTGDQKIQIGKVDAIETQEVSVFTGTVNGDTVFFIDTPGFDDSDGLDDADVLELIAQKLNSMSEEGISLTSILYLHKISDNRFTGSSKRLHRVFEKVCGRQAYDMVVLGTTMWSELARASDGENREEALRKGDFWGRMMRDGTETYRLNDSSESALPLAQLLAAKRGTPLQMQDELLSGDGQVICTSAGQELDRILVDRINRAVEKATHEKYAEKLERQNAEIQRLREEREKLRQINVSEVGFL
ncbi:hypothetical protein Neosp_000001 [[Neocosmospora] mangrovei]